MFYILYGFILAQIIMLILLFIKRISNGVYLIIGQVLTYVAAQALLIYYSELPIPEDGFMPGLAYIGEAFLCVIAMGISALLFLITLTVTVMRKNRSFLMLFSIVFLAAGLVFVMREIDDNWGIKRIEATVEKYEVEQIGPNEVNKMYLTFWIDGIEYKDDLIVWQEEYKPGDKIKVHVKETDIYTVRYYESYFWQYFPLFVLSAVFASAYIIKKKKSIEDGKKA